MTPAFGHKGGLLFLGEETEYGTAITRTKVVEIISEGITKDQAILETAGLNALISDSDDTAAGRVVVAGDIGFEWRYEGFEWLVKHALGSVSSAEQATFVVEDSGDGQNDKIDFIEDDTNTFAATLAPGTYIMGADSSVTDSLAKLIKDALELAGAGTYTVTFAAGGTNKLTIAVATGATAVEILTDGTNASDSAHTLLGFTTNSGSAASVIGDTALVAVYKHTFTMADALPIGLSMEIDADIKSKLIEGGKINALTFNGEADGFLTGSVGIIGEDLILDTPTTSLSLTTAKLIPFTQFVATWGGAIDLKSFSVALANNLTADRYFINSGLIKEPVRSGTRPEITGTMSIDFESTSQFDDFIAQTAQELVITATGDVIKTSLSYEIALTMSKVILTAGTPSIADIGIIPLELPFKAYATDTSTRELKIEIQNTLASV